MTPGLWVFLIAVTIMTGNRAIEKSVDYRKRRKHSGGIDRYDLIATEKMILERVALITDKVNGMDVQFADRLNEIEKSIPNTIKDYHMENIMEQDD